MRQTLTLIIIAVFLIGTIGVYGCATRRENTTAAGAIAGGVIGGLTGHWIIGAGLGAALGYIAGTEWDRYDEQKAQESFRYNRHERWRNPNTGRTYESYPEGPVYQRQGQEYRDIIIVDERGSKRRTTVRRHSEDQWEVVK